MKLTLLLLLIGLGLAPLTQAQENFQDGYVITPGGDTLRGRIDHQDWVANPGKIVFLDGRTGGRAEYSATGIAGFGVGDEVYRSYTVRLSPYSQDPAVVTAPGWSDRPYDTTLLLRLVTAGRLTLWGFRDKAFVAYFFIQKPGQTPIQLLVKNKVVVHGAASDVITDNVYQFQLVAYVSKCSATADKPVPVAYEENALMTLINTYNYCGVSDEAPGRRRVAAHVLVLAGYLHSSVQPGGNTDATYAHWPVFNGPTGGLGVWLEPARGSKSWKRWGVVIDALYDDLSINSGRFQKNYYQLYTGKLAYMEVKGNIQLRYAYPIGPHLRPFLGIGFSNTLIFNNTSSQKYVDLSNNSTIRQPIFGDEGYLTKYRPGAFGVVGLAWKRWSIEGRYERTADLSNTTTGVQVPVRNIYGLVGFRF